MDEMMRLWQRREVDGVAVMEHDGYEIEIADLVKHPQLLIATVAEKSWATPEIVAGLALWALEVA